mgnify:CR=1 FL=1
MNALKRIMLIERGKFMTASEVIESIRISDPV